jgi:hypothetical protein
MNRHLSRNYKRRERYIRQHGRVTDKYQLHAWWLRGIAAPSCRRCTRT